MRDRLNEFGPNVQFVLVTFTGTANLPRYRRVNLGNQAGRSFTIVLDPTGDAYHRYGLGRATTRRIWGWRVLRKYVEIFRDKGFGDLRPATEDIHQLGGDFVIARDGTLAFGHWSSGPEDRPPVDELVAAVTCTGPGDAG